MLTNDDILIIQRKVDGTLTEQEETVFHALTASNPRAAELYKGLLCVQQKLRDDAAGIPAVDVTVDVMAAVEHKTKVRNVFLYGWKRYYAYAALFVLVFTLGVLAANYVIPPLGTWQQEDIAGTMTGKRAANFKDDKNGIEIHMEEYRKAGSFVNTLFVSSRDSLMVEFVLENNTPGNEPEPHLEQNHSVYAVYGKNAIFTITNPPVASTIIFTQNGKQVHKIKF